MNSLHWSPFSVAQKTYRKRNTYIFKVLPLVLLENNSSKFKRVLLNHGDIHVLQILQVFCFILTKLLSQCQANLDISKWMVYIDQKRCNAVAFYKADVVVYT